MITREDYMNNSSELHHAYYSQFVTQATKDFVLREFGMEKLKASKDVHLNDLCKHSQGTWTWDYSPVNTKLIRKAGECMSYSVITCVGKAAARILLEEEALNNQ